jgi:hypothetical protein
MDTIQKVNSDEIELQEYKKRKEKIADMVLDGTLYIGELKENPEFKYLDYWYGKTLYYEFFEEISTNKIYFTRKPIK